MAISTPLCTSEYFYRRDHTLLPSVSSKRKHLKQSEMNWNMASAAQNRVQIANRLAADGEPTGSKQQADREPTDTWWWQTGQESVVWHWWHDCWLVLLSTASDSAPHHWNDRNKTTTISQSHWHCNYYRVAQKLHIFNYPHWCNRYR